MAHKTFTLATFNVNSVRARLPIVLGWLQEHAPDALCMQETKVVDEQFPADEFEKLGYHVTYRGQKSYNGVAIASKHAPREVSFGFDDGDQPDEARLMVVRVPGMRIINTYVPQGRDVESDKYRYKLRWLERLHAWFAREVRPRVKLAWVGDINIAPQPEDVHDPKRLEGHVCFNPQVRDAMARIRDTGLVDVFRRHHPEQGHFTFFDYRVRGAVDRGLGWRVDHIHATSALANRCTDAFIDLAPRKMERPSDHTPLVARFVL